MTTFATFLFAAVVWMPNGTVQEPVARVETTMQACLADAVGFMADVESINAGSSPVMQMHYHIEPCHAVTNDDSRAPT